MKVDHNIHMQLWKGRSGGPKRTNMKFWHLWGVICWSMGTSFTCRYSIVLLIKPGFCLSERPWSNLLHAWWVYGWGPCAGAGLHAAQWVTWQRTHTEAREKKRESQSDLTPKKPDPVLLKGKLLGTCNRPNGPHRTYFLKIKKIRPLNVKKKKSAEHLKWEWQGCHNRFLGVNKACHKRQKKTVEKK